MAVRNDLTIDWDSSPRVIYVDAPSTEITIQDLHDSCRFYESQPSAMDNPVLIDTAGLEPLGGGTFVGLTATLQNAYVAFEARTGPTYTQCNVSGGNVVAVDANGSPLPSPVFPTAFTQVVVTASSSATTQSQAQLEHSSFDGGVWVNPNSGITGTEFPKGAPTDPVNNIPDAITIANARGFGTIYVVGNYTFDTGDIISGFKVVGQNAARSQFTVNAGADTVSAEILEAYVTGNLDGGTIIRNSVVDNINYINGFVYNCMLAPGTIYLGGAQAAHFLNCYSGVPGTGTPIIDCNGLGDTEDTPLAMRAYSGGIQLEGLTGGAAVSLDFISGQVKINLATCTNGKVVVRGNAKVFDTDGNHLMSGIYNTNLEIINEANFGEHVHDLWQLQGLDKDNPMTVTPTQRTAGSITQNITGDGTTTSTVTRQ